MSFLPRSALLLTIGTAVTVKTVGANKNLQTSGSDDQTNVQQAFAAEFSVTVSGGSSPTADASVETSWDKGTTWHEVAKMTQLSGAGSKKQLVDIDKLGPMVRATVTPGGSTPGNTTGVVRLLTSALLTVS
ncbi:MAG: hypothetical protein JNM72_26470 [Deltaproteobacteria bacterium]|jgi:hypothetical protein|nr:hypothetical protein [Deltaproteobacteria bacterium]